MIDVALFAYGFTHHRKVRKLSDAAFRLWVGSIDHVAEYDTGGVVLEKDLEPANVIVGSPIDRDRATRELVEAGLWVHETGAFRLVGVVPERKRLEEYSRKPRGSRRITAHLRSSVLLRDGMICGICRLPIDAWSELHIDHVIPHALGGETTYWNLQPAHARCNLSKGARL